MTVPRRTGLLLPLLLALALPARAAPGVFAVRPDWWDATIPRSPPVSQLTNPAVAWELLSATNSLWLKPLEGWRVAGPFDGARGQGMDTVLPPERAVTKSAMPGKGGMPVEWQEWKAGQPCPLVAEMKDSIVYGFHLLRVPAPTSTWLAFQGSGRYKVWVDGKPAIVEGHPNEVSAAFFDFTPGNHQVLVKLEVAAGAWSFRAAFTPAPPEQVEIRCRSLIVQRWPESTNDVERHGIEIARLYAQLGDARNFGFWVARVLASQRDPARFAALVASWDAVAADRPDMSAARSAVLRDCFIAARDNPPLRDALGATMLKSLTLEDAEAGIRAFRAAGFQPPPPVAAQFLSQCVLSNRLAQLPYWMDQYVRREPNTYQVTEFLRPLMAKAGDVVRQALFDSLEEAITNQAPDRSVPLIKFYAESALARGDSARLDRLLDLNEGAARRLLPFESALWDLDVARAELDQDRARAALAAAARARPAYTNDPKYDQTRAEVFKMRAGTARPGAILNDPDDAVQTLARFTRQNQTSRLHGYMRRMLFERGHFLVADPADNNLFTSAKSVYRALFAPHADTYNPFLAREVADLAARPGQAAEAERLQRRASLQPPVAAAASGARPLRTLAQVGAPSGVFGGQFDLPSGMEEACGEETRMACLGAWQPVLSGSGTDLDGLLVVQNSRGVAAWANGALRWSYVVPPNGSSYNRWAMGYGGICRPVRVGDTVVVRLEAAVSRFELIAFDARSGMVRWRWRGATVTEEPAGSPAVWRGTHVLVPALRIGNEESQLALVAIDAATGRETLRLPLCAATRLGLSSAACGNAGVSSCRMLPAPTVVGDSVYVDTGLGMVCALDLQDECVRWARLYQRKFDDVGGGMRVAVSPVVGSRNVLFAPADSRWILLVDRLTGALVHRRSDLSWTSLGRCGPESVLVTTPSSLQRLSLAGPESGKVIDRPRLLVVASLADGCVLGGSGELVLLDSQQRIVRSLPIPADVVPVCMDVDGRWWGWGGVAGCTWGRLDDSTARRPLRLPVAAIGAGPAAPASASQPYEAVWIPAAEGACRIRQNLLTRVNADGRPRWEVLLPPDASVMECGRRLLVNMRRRAWTLDDADGSVCSVWPPLTGATNDFAVFRISTCGPQAYAAVTVPHVPSRLRIWDLGIDGREPPVQMLDVPEWAGRATDFWVANIATQVFLISRALNDYEVRLFRALRAETPRTAPMSEMTFEAIWGNQVSATVWHDRMRRHAVIFARNPAETVRFDNRGMVRRPVQGLSELWTGARWSWGDLMVFRYVKDAFVRVTEPLEGGSVVLRERADEKMERPLWWFTGRIGCEVAGMQRLDTNRLMVFRQDLSQVSETTDTAARAVLTGLAPGPADEWRGVVSLGDGRTMFMASCKAERDEVMRGYIWTPGVEALTSVLLPAASQPLQPLGTNLWTYGEAFLTSADWARCVALESQVRRVSWTNRFAAADSFIADGFLDEWQDEEFTATPQGRLAVRRPGRGDCFRVAVEITDPAAVAAVAAAPDFAAACRVWAGRGDAANFDVMRTSVLPLAHETVMGDNRPVRRCAWQVTPDGRRATIELELALQWIASRGPGETPTARAQRFGDLALRLTFDDPLSGSADLAGTARLGALGFVRLLLP